MSSGFEYFVLFAEMRTGSNFLEQNLNSLPDLQCHGEAFNPNFIGYPNKNELLGISLAQRIDRPQLLLDHLRGQPGINGFRYFHDHDPRVLSVVLDDPRCAKVILTRNPVDSYVSWKIAQKTGQWKLTRVDRRKSATIRFDPAEYRAFDGARRDFHTWLRSALMVRGQAAFHLDYTQLQDVDVLNGLARYLGARPELRSVQNLIKRQNPAPVSEKVENLAEMEAALQGSGVLDTTSYPNQEPERGPGVPGYYAGRQVPLLYQPIEGPARSSVIEWLGKLDGTEPDYLPSGFTQKSLRQWKRQHPGHRSVTVVSHPVDRSHWVFCQFLAALDDAGQMRRIMRHLGGTQLDQLLADADSDPKSHRACFLMFLDALRASISGQTGLKLRPDWTSQAQVLQDMSKFGAPDVVIRADRLQSGLDWICSEIGAPMQQISTGSKNELLASIYDQDIEKAVKAAYHKDYMMFGFGRWPDQAA